MVIWNILIDEFGYKYKKLNNMEITYWYWLHNNESEINKMEKIIGFAEESDYMNDEIKWGKIIGLISLRKVMISDKCQIPGSHQFY